MPVILPTFESVVTPEYWDPIPAPRTFTQRTSLGKAYNLYADVEFNFGKMPDSVTEIEVVRALGQSTFNLLAGQLPEPVEEGELVGGKDDLKYAVPGNILILDTEQVAFEPDHQKRLSGQVLDEEADLAASSLSLLLSGIERETSYVVEPRSYGMPEPLRSLMRTVEKLAGLETEPVKKQLGSDSRTYVPAYAKAFASDKGFYRRSVALVAFFDSKDGGVGSRMAYMSVIYDQGRPTAWISPVHPHVAGRVGETTNLTIHDKWSHLARLRGAYICERGAFERAKAPAKTERKLKILSPVIDGL